MSKYANKQFWVDAADRVVATFAQTFLSASLIGDVGLNAIDLGTSLSIAGGAAVASLLTAIAFRGSDSGKE